MRFIRIFSVGAMLMFAGIGAEGASAATQFFHSPSGNIQCEVVSKDSPGSYAYCQTSSPARSVQLELNGVYKVCTGVACIGDGPTDAFTLAAGKSVVVGPFRCTSKSIGMQCMVASSGKGFLINRRGVTRL